MILINRALIAFIFTLLCSNIVNAQKDAPVLGQTTQLLELLNKDYKTIDPELREDEIVRDRTTVIAIFKSYLMPSSLKKLQDHPVDYSPANSKRTELDAMVKQRAYFVSQSPAKPGSDELKRASEVLKELDTNIAKQKHEIVKGFYDADLSELKNIKKEYADSFNKFIDYFICQFINKYTALNNQKNDTYAITNTSGSVTKSLPLIGGDLSFETYMDGLARFLAKRIKEEITVFVIDRVKLWLNNPGIDDPLAEFKVILPQTTRYLKGFAPEKITSFPNEIKQYIEDDLKHILENASGLKYTPKIQNLIARYPELDFAFEAIETIPNLSKAKYPIDYFNFMEGSRNLGKWKLESDTTKHNLANMLFLSSMVAHSLIILENGEPRISGIDIIQKYASENNFFFLFVGLLHQQNKKYYHIEFYVGNDLLKLDEELGKIVKVDPNDVWTVEVTETKKIFNDLLNICVKSAEKVFTTASDIRKAKKAGKAVGVDLIYPFVDNIIGLSEKITEASDIMVNHFAELKYGTTDHPYHPYTRLTSSKPYFNIARSTNELTRDLVEKKYAIALIKTLEISEQLFNKQSPDLGLSESISNLFNISYSDITKSWYSFIKILSKDQEEITGEQYTTFKIIGAELGKMEYFYFSKYSTDANLLNALRKIRTMCETITKGGNLDNGNGRQGIYDLFSVSYPELRKFIISYYSGLPYEILKSNISSTLIKITIPAPPPVNSVQIFQQPEIDNFLTLLEYYSQEIFTNYFIEGNKIESKELKKYRESLSSVITRYMTYLPQRLNPSINPSVIQLVHFVNDLAISQNAEDIEKSINSFALPSGSYSIKRKVVFNVALNAYPGILLGNEISWPTGSQKHESAFSIGFTAPVGLSFSWGDHKVRGVSDGIFVPIIDIGALTRLRLDNSSTTNTLPDFTFKNIFSPGIYYTHGFRKSPMSVNIGIQYGPDLKEILLDASGNPNGESRSFESIRIGVGFVLDIPLFNLFTKPR